MTTRLPEASGEHRIDAVLTLTLKDCERVPILLRSLKLFEPLGTCWIVVPDAQLREIAASLPNVHYEVVPESVVIPELSSYRRLYRYHPRRTRRRVGGDQIHQIIKLAMASHVRTPFYLTLDADVICLKLVRYDDVIRNGRAINKRFTRDIHPAWYAWAERVLGLPRSGFTHGLTPAVLSREAVVRLHEFLEGRISPALRALARRLPATWSFRDVLGSWRSYLIRNRPWTEYSLYGTFLEATNLYDSFHFAGDGETTIYSHCVWTARDFETWDPRNVISEQDSYFSVVQSTARIAPRLVIEKVAPYIDLRR